MEVALPHLDQVPTGKVPPSSLKASDSPRRSGENLAHVRTLAQSEDPFPPIVVHRATMRVVDGMHRLRAAELRGENEIEVRFVDGDDASTFVLAVSENVRHGLPLSTADRKAAAARIIGFYPEWSDRMVATVSGLSAGTVAITRERMAQDSKPHAQLYTVGRDGRVRPRDSAQRRELARKLLRENPDCSLREAARLAGISPETARDVRNRLNHDGGPDRAQGSNENGATPAAQREPPEVRLPASPGRGPAAVGAKAVHALRADPAFRSTESGRVLLRMLAAYQMLEDHGDGLLERIPVHSTDRVAVAARACARAWEAYAERLEQRSRMRSPGNRQA